ncbi:MAG: hypothetical protein K8R85_10955 [Bacteroidetes bacterium]|nr:hypothetical protein [Bacteroidota bacterium]
MTKYKRAILFFSCFLLLTPLTIYFINFCHLPISKDTEIWGQFGDYLNGTFMPIIALSGVIVTLLLGLISDKRNLANIEIDQQKQRPLLHIGYFDGSEKLEIFMKNKGNGPLLISDYKLVHLLTNKELPSIFASLPGIHRRYNNYTGNQKNTVLSPNEITEILLFKLSEDDDKTKFENSRQSIRAAISNYKIVIEYHDVYNKKMPTYERNLEWFGRPETI